MTGENIETQLSRTAIPAAAADSPGSADSGAKHRRSLLELAPLELDCMQALWILGPATVRDVRDRIAPHRPRAYTTIMTILDRLARKGAVERSKMGRAYLYRASLSAEQARSHAVGQVIENFFGGSTEALLSQLHNSGVRTLRTGSLRSAGAAVPRASSAAAETPAVMAAEAGAASASVSLSAVGVAEREPETGRSATERAPEPSRRRLDETLL
jgi:predicted transcriptional regulator